MKYGNMLLDALLTDAKKNGKKSVMTSLQWGWIWPGFFVHSDKDIEFAKKTGARLAPGELYVELSCREINAEILNTGDPNYYSKSIKIKHYEDKAFKSLQYLLKYEFGTGWTHEVLNKVSTDFECFNGYGLASAYNPMDVFIVYYNDELCGFCIVQSQTGTNQSFFGPIGLTENMRGNGIGKFLTFEALDYLKKMGKNKVGLWTNVKIYNAFTLCIYRPYGT